MKKDASLLSVPLSIQIADRQFTLKCPPEKIEDLKASAQYVDTLFRTAMKGKANIPSTAERTALMTAINIAYELREQQQRLDALQEKIEHALRDRESQPAQ